MSIKTKNMTAKLDVRQNSVDIDPDWYAGQPETAEDTQPGDLGATPTVTVPTVLTKLQKWGDYESWGEPVWPSRFIPMKTPLSQEILDNWQLSNPPKHRLTVNDILAAQAAADRHVGLILDLSNHDCLYLTDVPPTVDYLHVQLVAKELPPLEFVQEVGRAANHHWSQHGDSYIAIHCAYGFNRTGFVVCSYLIEHCGLSVEGALQSFARSRPPGVKHEKFKNELHARYGLSNLHIQRPLTSCGPICVVCGRASCSTTSSSTTVTASPVPSQLNDAAAAGDSQSSTSAAVEDCSSSNSAVEANCTNNQAPAAAAKAASVLNIAAEQHAVAPDLRRSSYSSGGGNSQKPPPAPQLAQLLTSSSSIEAPYTLPRIPDNMSSPLALVSGRCYSSGSMGDNSSIGCSPTDSAADVLLTGGSSSHSSVSQGCPAGRSPLAAVRQQQQQPAGPGPHCLGRRGGLQGSSSNHNSYGRLGCSVPNTASSTAAAATAAAGMGRGAQSRGGSESAVAGDNCNDDVDAFEIDPCGEERDDSNTWRCNDAAGVTTNGWCADGVSYQEQRQEQQHGQGAYGSQQLLELMAAVRLGQQQQGQQEQQPSEQYHSPVTGANCDQQQQALDASAAESAAGAARECNCSCHAVDSTVRRSSHDGGILQTQLRYGVMTSAGGRRPGGLQELVDNESFGRVTTADMLLSLRNLQEQHQSS